MFPGNKKISYVPLIILNGNCSTLASDKRPSFLFSCKNIYFKRIQIEPAEGIEFSFGWSITQCKEDILSDGGGYLDFHTKKPAKKLLQEK